MDAAKSEEYEFIFLKNDMNSQDKMWRGMNSMVVRARVIAPMNSMVCSNGGKLLTPVMVVANSTSTQAFGQ